MDFKQFWEEYYMSKDITTFSDVVIDVFSKTLPSSVEKEYDLSEVLTEFVGHHETAKKYDKIEAFGKVLKESNLNLYQEEGKYIHESLIKYFCFLDEKEKLKPQIEDALSDEFDYDFFLQSFKQLLFNQYIEEVDFIIEQQYNRVKNDPNLLSGAEFDLTRAKYYIELEQLYQQQKDATTSNFDEFQSILSQYDFVFEDLYIEHLRAGLFEESNEGLQSILQKFPTDRTNAMAFLEMRFLKMMRSKNCPFPVAGILWDNLFTFFEEQRGRSWQSYFDLKSKPFYNYIDSKYGFFIDNTAEVVSIIWGSSYFVDFLYKEGILSELKYQNQQKIIKKLKTDFKESNKYDLWEYCFVHKWKPSESIELKEWEAEKKEFKDSYDLEIKQENFEDFDLDSFFGDSFSEGKNKKSKLFRDNVPKTPTIEVPKIGRNDKVTVEYKDGTIKKDIKFKKVLKDIKNGDCKII